MPRLRNINPLGEVDVPLLHREGDNGAYADPDEDGYQVRTPVEGSGCLERGEEFDVTAEHAALLLEQAGNYELVKPAAKAAKSEEVA